MSRYRRAGWRAPPAERGAGPRAEAEPGAGPGPERGSLTETYTKDPETWDFFVPHDQEKLKHGSEGHRAAMGP